MAKTNMKNCLISLLLMLLAMSTAARHNGVFIEDFEVEPGSSVIVPVMLCGSDSTRGVQFNMTLPLGLTMETYELDEDVVERYNMHSYDRCTAGVWTVGIYPYGRICLPADTTIVIMRMTLNAAPDFDGGDIFLWKERGAQMDNSTIIFNDDTTAVTVPQASIMELGNKDDSLWPMHL